MISEERLKELIEQTKPVYAVIKTKQWRNLDRERYMAIDLRFDLSNTPPLVIRNDANFEDQVINYEDLYETKEQAEWERDFQRIERTEYLDLPSWEEFTSEYKYHPISFTSKNGISVIWVMKVLKEIEIRECYRGAEYTIFDKKLTKGNYREACEMAKRLFLGEEEK